MDNKKGSVCYYCKKKILKNDIESKYDFYYKAYVCAECIRKKKERIWEIIRED